MKGERQRRSRIHFKGWLLFFFKLPSKPVNSRMKIWRKLNRAGAVLLKGTVYLLPDTPDNQECFDWLVEEVSALGGESALVRSEKIENMAHGSLIDLFNQQREREYHAISNKIDDLDKIIASVQKGGLPTELKSTEALLKKARKDYCDIVKIDFFESTAGRNLDKYLIKIETNLELVSQQTNPTPPLEIPPQSLDHYQGKTWITRPNPFVDRMSSAWLIRKYIDPKATFQFSEDLPLDVENGVSFDMRNADFTHIGDLCTFEVLLKAFNFREKPLKKIAEIVHDLDIKDDKYGSAEAKGIEAILTGIRTSIKDDLESLEKGILVFDLFFTSIRF